MPLFAPRVIYLLIYLFLLCSHADFCLAALEGSHCAAQDGRTALTPYPPLFCCSFLHFYLAVMLNFVLLLWKAAIVQLKMGGQP